VVENDVMELSKTPKVRCFVSRQGKCEVRGTEVNEAGEKISVRAPCGN